MIELIIASSGWLVAGIVIGARLWRRKPKPVKAICDCGHALANHDPKSNKCNVSVDSYWQDGVKTFVGCACRQYVGPQPLASMFELPIATDKD